MSYLSRIEAKLDELVKSKNKEEAEKQPTQEEKDEERMREIEEKITDLIELLNSGTTRDSADDKIRHARERVKSGKGEPRPLLKVFHEHKGKKIPTTRRTQVLTNFFAAASWVAWNLLLVFLGFFVADFFYYFPKTLDDCRARCSWLTR